MFIFFFFLPVEILEGSYLRQTWISFLDSLYYCCIIVAFCFVKHREILWPCLPQHEPKFSKSVGWLKKSLWLTLHENGPGELCEKDNLLFLWIGLLRTALFLKFVSKWSGLLLVYFFYFVNWAGEFPCFKFIILSIIIEIAKIWFLQIYTVCYLNIFCTIWQKVAENFAVTTKMCFATC